MSQSIDVKGYVRIYRKMLENPLFTDKPAEWFKLWIMILLRVNWRPSVFRPHAGESVEIPAGSMVTSLEKLAHTGELTKEQARKCLDYLERTHVITLQRTHHWTKISVLNWRTYQQVDDAPEHTPEHTVEHTQFEVGSANGTHAGTHAGTLSKEYKNNSTTLSNSGELDHHRRTSRKSKPGIDPDVLQWFDAEFWPIYPRHEAKQKSLEAADKIATSPEKRAHYIARLNAQLPEYLRRKTESGQRVIPLGSTWFNQGRADDDLPSQAPLSLGPRRASNDADYPEYVPLGVGK